MKHEHAPRHAGNLTALLLVFLAVLVLTSTPIFAASFSTGTASESVETRNVNIMGLCLYGDGTNSSSLYLMDDNDGNAVGDNIVSDTLYLAAGDRGPVCLSYGVEGGIDCRGIVTVLGGTGGRYGITYNRR